MTIDNTKQPEALADEPKALPNSEPEKTIDVDIFGTSITMPVSKAKEIIAKRDEKTKSYNELKAKIITAESQAKAEAERSSLLELMKKQDTQAVEDAVGAKYKDTISRFEKRVYQGDIKASLAKLGVLPEAIDDTTKLVLADASPTLDGDAVKLNGVALEDYLKPWVAGKPHILAAAKPAADGKKKIGKTDITPPKPEKSNSESIKSGLSKFIK